MKVLAESFHLNGHSIGFRPQTQKLESPYKTLSNTLAVKGLINELTLDPKKPHYILGGRHGRLSTVNSYQLFMPFPQIVNILTNLTGDDHVEYVRRNINQKLYYVFCGVLSPAYH